MTAAAAIHLGNSAFAPHRLGFGWGGASMGLSLASEPDGTISITATGPGSITVTVAGTTIYDGNYTFDPALLTTGPVFLVVPEITGTGTVGQTLSRSRPGLCVYDEANGAPTITLQWQADGTDISGATSESYTLTAGEGGKAVRLAETATQAGVGARSANSATISVASAFTPQSLGDKLLRWFDFTSFSGMYQNTARTTPVTAAGQTCLGVIGKDPLSKFATVDDGTSTAIAGGLDVNNARWVMWEGFPAASVTDPCEVYALYQRDGDTSLALIGERFDDLYRGGLCVQSSSSAPNNKFTGTVIHSVEGVDLSSPNAGAIYTAVAAAGAGYVIQSLRGINLNILIDGTPLRGVMMGKATNDRFSGNLRHYIVTEALTSGERADLLAWLNGQK